MTGTAFFDTTNATSLGQTKSAWQRQHSAPRGVALP
jgi:hypothetical protein